jgi:hypothetical protein
LCIDATTLQANAAMKSLVRRDTGIGYDEYLRQLAQAEGIENPTKEQATRLDRNRKKKGSNDDWTNPNDLSARITKMKDWRTKLAHKAEHAVDLADGAVLAVTVQPRIAAIRRVMPKRWRRRKGSPRKRTRRDRRSGDGQGLSQRRGNGGSGQTWAAQLRAGAGAGRPKVGR